MNEKAPEISVELPDPLGDGFDQPLVIDDVLYAFPGHVERLMPLWETIPAPFREPNSHTEWNQFVSDWFFLGWPEDRYLYSRPDVDSNAAFRHLHTILRSFEPKHEYKEAAVAWLMSRWFAAIRPMQQQAEGKDS